MARKSLKDEALMAKVVNLSWLTLSRAFSSKKVTEEGKIRIAIEIAKKTCPQSLKILGDPNEPLRVVAYIPQVKSESP